MSSPTLTEWLDGLQQKPFSWSTWHCCHFASSWVAFATGRDHMANKPTVADVRSARRAVNSFGGNLQVAISNELGAQPINPKLAKLGDIVLLPADNDEGVGLVGICNGRVSFFLNESGGITSIPTEQAQCAWAIK